MRKLLFIVLLGLALQASGQSDQYLVTNKGDTIWCNSIRSSNSIFSSKVRLETTSGEKMKIDEDDIEALQMVKNDKTYIVRNLMKPDTSGKVMMELLLDENGYQLYTDDMNVTVPVSSGMGGAGGMYMLPVGKHYTIRVYQREKFIEEIEGSTMMEQVAKFYGDCAASLLNKENSTKASWGGKIADMAERYYSECGGQ